MSTTITPQAIDAFVHIESIRLVDRHRRDLGDLESLAASIRDVGLLNPVTIRPDNRLVAGQRRIEAMRRLGHVEIPVRIVRDLDEASRLLRAERDENTERKEMLPSEKASLGEALYEIEEQNAKDRQRVHGGTAPGRSANTCGDVSTSVPGAEKNKTRHLVGEALGMSGRMYSDLRYVYKATTDPDLPAEERDLAKAALDKMDRVGGVGRAGQEFRQLQRARRDAQEAKAAALAAPVSTDLGDGFVEPPSDRPQESDEGWMPRPHDNRPEAIVRRGEIIRACAVRGMSSEQIGHHLDLSPATVRKTARMQDIDIPADKVMARVKKKIDSNRIVRETLQTLEGLEMGLNLVDFDELDPAEIGDWTVSLGESIRRLNRLNKRLKEKAQ